MRNKTGPFTLILILISVWAGSALADYQRTPDKGWFFYETPPQHDLEDLVLETPKEEASVKPVVIIGEAKDPCLEEATWTDECGFVNPGNDFKFQEKQRDALLVRMVMNPESSKAVEDFQYYTKWMFDQASQVANMWYYNRIQNPELDPQAANPVSQFGLRLVGELGKSRADDIFKLLSEESLLVYFTRTDCSFCHQMAETILRLEERTGIETWDASLDEECIPGFERCRTIEETEDVARALQVATVPALFLFVKPNTWIRVATGVTDSLTIESRIVNFFSAYRSALIKGIDSDTDNRAPADFTPVSNPWQGRGTGVGVESGAGRTPSEDEVRTLLQLQ